MKWICTFVLTCCISAYSQAQFTAQANYSLPQCVNGSCSGVRQAPVVNAVTNVVQPVVNFVRQPVQQLQLRWQQVTYKGRWGRTYVQYEPVYVYVTIN